MVEKKRSYADILTSEKFQAGFDEMMSKTDLEAAQYGLETADKMMRLILGEIPSGKIAEMIEIVSARPRDTETTLLMFGLAYAAAKRHPNYRDVPASAIKGLLEDTSSISPVEAVGLNMVFYASGTIVDAIKAASLTFSQALKALKVAGGEYQPSPHWGTERGDGT